MVLECEGWQKDVLRNIMSEEHLIKFRHIFGVHYHML